MTPTPTPPARTPNEQSERRRREADPTLVRNQPALTSSSGLAWIIVGGILAVTGIAVLAPLIGLGPPGVAVGGIVVLAAIYLVMVVVRFTTAGGRFRLAIMAACMIAIAVVALVAVGIVTADEWSVVR
ncbi:hypothetical protein [Marisediminicola antarctica]|uniref:Uncharacterized protein n=1 Tax=Marisediminicola antarctica TaxID=674079 RepID=A0A7L5AJV3_9MICO|nr:hypothetical protein [Marisediminicola antarctica]QHO70075.1 hypothetical protein BHD05_10905 [Marisediminicola antarctica]